MKKGLGTLGLCFILIIGALLPQGKVIAAVGSVTISANSVNIREGPGLSYPLMSHVNKGDKYPLIAEKGDWSQLQLSNGKTGWVASWLITKCTNLKIKTGIVTDDNLNIRNEPSLSSSVLGKLSKGMTVYVYSQKDNWLEIRFSNKKAWVSSQFISIKTTDANSTAASNPNGVTGYVTANGIRVRNGASLDANIIGTVDKGQKFAVFEEVNNWAKIEYKTGNYGWVAGWYLDKSYTHTSSSNGQDIKESTITILQNGSNIRKSPNLDSDVLQRANEGDKFPVQKVTNEWYEIKLKNGATGFVAGWIVSINGSAPQIEKPGAENYLKNKTIVVDPGHGGQDDGTTGVRGTFEKDLTLRTAKLLYDKLKASGANVILTRNNDSYISLPSRVSTSIFQQADAFVSLHYDSNTDRSVRGMTGYYYYSYQKPLAQYLYTSTLNQTMLKDRGIRFGDFHVIRENSQKATLLELGYLSNPEEELTLTSGLFQESAATGIYNGLAHYFKDY
jgi:N-acetylmuramoyl-L-alanine amidase